MSSQNQTSLEFVFPHILVAHGLEEKTVKAGKKIPYSKFKVLCVSELAVEIRKEVWFYCIRLEV